MNTFKVVYKDIESNDLKTVEVNKAKASECIQKQGTAKGLYVGNAYITGLEIKKITESTNQNYISPAAYCGRCHKGWMIEESGAYPCECNRSGTEKMSEYRRHLSQQGFGK